TPPTAGAMRRRYPRRGCGGSSATPIVIFMEALPQDATHPPPVPKAHPRPPELCDGGTPGADAAAAALPPSLSL
ncbi:MAG TPA: hypothetical protein PLV45_04110, partial [bacterium]|nr:hypothetical protein [bacterium]